MTRNSILLLYIGLLVALAQPKALLADDAHDDGDGENECPGTDLVCLHNTTCIEGDANFTWHPARPGVGDKFDFSKETSRHGFHCDCPLGLTGLRCGRTYESCNDGDHTCFNGGTLKESWVLISWILGMFLFLTFFFGFVSFGFHF